MVGASAGAVVHGVCEDTCRLFLSLVSSIWNLVQVYVQSVYMHKNCICMHLLFTCHLFFFPPYGHRNMVPTTCAMQVYIKPSSVQQKDWIE